MWDNSSAFNVRASASKLNKASGSLFSVCIPKYREADRGSRLDDQFYTQVKTTESQRWDRTQCCIRRCEARTRFPCRALWRYISLRLCWSVVFIFWPVYLPKIFTGWCDKSTVQWEECCSSWRITLCVYRLLFERFMQRKGPFDIWHTFSRLSLVVVPTCSPSSSSWHPSQCLAML